MLVIHDFGDERGGAAWRAAFGATGWSGPVHAPDLPGHGDAPAPVGGNYELGEGVFALLALLRELREDPLPVIVGVGGNGWSAQLLALGGRASALVLVDGLGGPWLDPRSAIHLGRDHARAVADDPEAMAPPPTSGLDPRLRHGVYGITSRKQSLHAAAQIPVPTLLIESVGSNLSRDEAAEVVAAFTAPVELVNAEADPGSVAPLVRSWAAGLALSSVEA